MSEIKLGHARTHARTHARILGAKKNYPMAPTDTYACLLVEECLRRRVCVCVCVCVLVYSCGGSGLCMYVCMCVYVCVCF